MKPASSVAEIGSAVTAQKSPAENRSGNQQGAIENCQPDSEYPYWKMSMKTLTGYSVSLEIHRSRAAPAAPSWRYRYTRLSSRAIQATDSEAIDSQTIGGRTAGGSETG